jgi:hypothetical protein
MTRRSLLALLAAGVSAAVPAVASAALLWTLVATPLTTTANVSTTFSLTATNLDLLTELGCLEVDLPTSFVIESLGTPIASHGETWASTRSGNSVIVQSLSSGGRLKLGWSVSFTIRAHALVAGTYPWPNHAHQRQDCTSADQIGTPLSVIVLPALVPTPTPPPAATPTPAPTSSPTASPTPILPLPSISLIGLPSLAPSVSPTPSPSVSPTPPPAPGQTSSSTSTPEPGASAAGIDGDGPGTTGPGSGGNGAGAPAQGAGGQALTVARTADNPGADADVGLELLGLLDSGYLWFVPAAPVALPGLLVILWVLLQAVGALAWIPAVRRLSGDDRRRRGGPSAA